MKIKQGNDIKVSVPVNRINGEQSVAENMETAKSIVLLLCNKNFRSVVHQITEYTVSDNVISFVVGKGMQNVLGKYRVELKYDQIDPTQADGLQSFSADKDVYELVEFTSETDASQVGDVTVTSVEIALGVQAGINGLSAYEIALSNGFVGTVSEWLLSLKGEKGDKGDQGIQGVQGIKGDKGDTGAQGIQGERGLQGDQGIQGIQGIQGLKGDKGDTGEKGADGVQIGETSTTAYAGDKGKKLATDLAQLSADLSTNIEPALAEILNALYARIIALESIIKNSLYKNMQVDSLDIVKGFNIYGSTNLMLTGTAAPAIVPDFIGQFYINTTGGVCYQAKGIASTSDWKQISN